MKGQIEQWLHRRWYGGVEPGMGLRALAGIYRVVAGMDRPRPCRLPVPVVVIGNFTAGGTGKTPLVIALAEHLQSMRFNPGIVSRGYGRKSKLPVRVATNTSAAECGDEPKVMFERTGVPVFVDRDRVAAARAAVASGCTVILSDDGLQHRRLSRDIEIEVVDGQRRYGNGLLLPAGPLREPPRPCDFKVLTGSGSHDNGEWTMAIQLGDALSVGNPGTIRPLARFSDVVTHAVAGIGNPGRFFNALRDKGINPVEHAFPDHHDFVQADFEGMVGAILMTEKDAVKCRALHLENAWSVPVDGVLSPGFLAALVSRLRESHVAY